MNKVAARPRQYEEGNSHQCKGIDGSRIVLNQGHKRDFAVNHAGSRCNTKGESDGKMQYD
jgi:hypothetical protein